MWLYIPAFILTIFRFSWCSSWFSSPVLKPQWHVVMVLFNKNTKAEGFSLLLMLFINWSHNSQSLIVLPQAFSRIIIETAGKAAFMPQLAKQTLMYSLINLQVVEFFMSWVFCSVNGLYHEFETFPFFLDSQKNYRYFSNSLCPHTCLASTLSTPPLEWCIAICCTYISTSLKIKVNNLHQDSPMVVYILWVM